MTDVRLGLRRVSARARLLAHVTGRLGLPMVGLVVANSANRRKAMRKESAERERVAAAVSPGQLERVEPMMGGARFLFHRCELEVCFLALDVVRLSWAPGPEPVPYALAEDPGWSAPALAVLDELADGWTVRGDALEVRVGTDGAVCLARRDGTVLRRTAPPGHRRGRWQQEFDIRPGERFSGLGEQSSGVDLRGGRFRLWNRDAGGAWGPGSDPLYMGIPVVLASHPEGNLITFYENSTHAVFSFGDKLQARDEPATGSVSFAGGMLRSYVVTGSLPHLLDRYSELTGRPAIPPRWALGYHQSRWGYRTQKHVREVIEGYEREKLPLSAVHLDIDYMDGYRVFTVDSSRFPDLRALTSYAAEHSVRIVTIVDPGVKVDPDYDLYAEGASLHHFCSDGRGHAVEGVVWPGKAVFPDFTDQSTRSWWAEQYRFLTAEGVAGVWHDMNEPASIALMGDPTLPLETRHHFEGRGGDHAEGHNLYGLLMNRSGFAGLVRAAPERRPFIVSRSGWAGEQRWAWNWTGDVASTWAAMRQQIATIVGLGLSGVPFAGSDIGGFSGVPEDELYLRWLQMSVFMGFCRTHSVVGAPAREPWRFGDPVRSIVGAWIRFRYRLLPYLYTLAHQAAEHGAPLVRPAWWPSDSPEGAAGGSDRSGGDVDDEFLLGEALLVAPVVRRAARARRVWLPPGEWTSLWAPEPGEAAGEREGRSEQRGQHARRERYGRAETEVSAPLEHPPVMVRVGSILTLDDGFAEFGGPCAIGGDSPLVDASGPPSPDHRPRLLSFHCWASGDGTAGGLCVDDAGDGYGPSRRDELRLEGAVPRRTAPATLEWRRSGEFDPPKRVRVVLHGLEASTVVADGEEVGGTENGAIECAAFERLELRGIEPL